MTTSSAYSFTRTGRTWGALLLAAIAWLIVSLWAYRVAATQIEQPGADASATLSGRPIQETSANTPGIAATSEQDQANEIARLAAERMAQEQASLVAEQEAAEQKAAEQAAAEQEIAKKKAAEQALQVVQQRAEEQVQEVAQEDEQAEEKQASEPAELERAMAAEQARLAARSAAEHQSRLRAQKEEASQVAELSVEFEPQNAQAEREAQAAQEAQAEREAQAALEAENARKAAAEEARRVAANAARISAYEQLRKEETGVLAELSENLQFQGRSEVIDREIERTLDTMFEPLFLYAEMAVVIAVSTNEFRGPADNVRLSRERARAVVTYLVGRGLQEQRFDIQADPGEGLPYGSHRVKVSVEDPIQ